VRRGLTRLLRLSSREKLNAGPGGGPVLRCYRRKRRILQSRFVYSRKVPHTGDAAILELDHDCYCVLDVWAAETDRYAGVKGGFRAALLHGPA
jgi:hypothetical protein